MSGAVVWLTGLPACGKSTLAARIHGRLAERLRPCCVLDGDEVRACLAPVPGHGERDRELFYTSLANLAALLARQDLVVLVPATAHRARHRAIARAAAPRFVEVHVDTSLAECEARDPKSLYAGARAGTLTDLPGVGVDYEAPVKPEVVAHGGHDDAAVDAVLALVGF